MDAKNRFATRTTFALLRLEWLAALAVSLVLAVRHREEIRWWVFAALFAVIDVIGYLPGAIAVRRSPDRRVARGYHVAYNVMHSLVTAGLLAAAWAWFVRPEWAVLALPIHVMGHRALFGNCLKPAFRAGGRNFRRRPHGRSDGTVPDGGYRPPAPESASVCGRLQERPRRAPRFPDRRSCGAGGQGSLRP